MIHIQNHSENNIDCVLLLLSICSNFISRSKKKYIFIRNSKEYNTLGAHPTDSGNTVNYMLHHSNIWRLMCYVVDMAICKVTILQIYITLNDIVGICFTEMKKKKMIGKCLVHQFLSCLSYFMIVLIGVSWRQASAMRQTIDYQ